MPTKNSYRAAAAVPGVSFIWSLCGSSLGIFLCLSLPAAFYLKVCFVCVVGLDRGMAVVWTLDAATGRRVLGTLRHSYTSLIAFHRNQP